MSYIIAFFVMLALYILMLYLFKYMKNEKVWNIVFACTIFLIYATHSIIVCLDAGFHDWNFQNTLPTANVSPFMFCLAPIILILPKKIKKYFLTLVAILIVGMFFSTLFNCVYNAVIHYKFHFHFMLDYIAHFIYSLWGVYIIKTGQVELNKKDCLKSSLIIYIAATTMLVLNLIFDTSFFGLSLTGKHNIYNMVLVSSSVFSALIYYVGVFVVLMLGYIMQNIINRKSLLLKNGKGEE